MKKIIACLIKICMLAGLVVLPEPVSAAEGDFVINRVWMSNQAWEGGEELDILVSWRYVGTEQISESTKTPVTVTNLDGLVAKEPNNTTALSGRTFPKNIDQVYRINRVVPDSEDISFTLNMRGNKFPVELSSLKGKSDAEVIRLETAPECFSQGDAVDLYAWVKNDGTEIMGPEEFPVVYTVDGVEYRVNTSVYIQPGERKRIFIDSFKAAKEKNLDIKLQLNPERLIKEGSYDNNCGFITISSYTPHEDWIWDNMVHHGGGCVRHVHSNAGTGTYMRTDMGGVYRYNYEFEKWENLTSDFEKEELAAGEPYRLQDTTGLTVAPGPDGEDIVYLLTGQFRIRGRWEAPQLLRSTDSGKTWATVFNLPLSTTANNSGNAGNTVEVDPNNPNVLWILSVTDGVWYTENALDAAPVWHKIELPGFTPKKTHWNTENSNDGYSAVGFDTNSVKNGKTQTVYVATWSGGIFRSVNGGKTFTHMKNSPNRVWEFAESSDGRVYACVFYDETTGTKGVWCIDSGSSEWINYLPTEKNINIQGIDVAPWDSDIVGINCSDSTILVSHDGGKTWGEDLVNGTEYVPHNYVKWNGRSLYTTYFTFDAHIKGRIFFGDSCGSIDDIYAVQRVRRDRIRGLEELEVRDIKKPKGHPVLYFASQDGGLRRSETIFEYEFTPKADMSNGNNPYALDYCANHPEWLFIGGARNWYAQGNPCLAYSDDADVTLHDMQPMVLNETVDSENGKITRTGASIAALASSADFNKNGVPTLVAVSEQGVFQRTEDLGETWENIKSPFMPAYYGFTGARALASDKMHNGVFYAMDRDKGELYRSDNDGVSFQKYSTGWGTSNFGDIYSMVFQDGLLWGSSEGLEVSFDGGATHEKCADVQNVIKIGTGVGKTESSPEVIYILGVANHKFGLHMSEDLGKTWKYISGHAEDDIGFFGESNFDYTSCNGLDGDKERYGVVYVGSRGMGVFVGMARESDFRPTKLRIYNEEKTNSREQLYELSGRVDKQATVNIEHNSSHYSVQTDTKGYFKSLINLTQGDNTITISAGTEKTGIATQTMNVEYNPSYIGIAVDKYQPIVNKAEFTIKGTVTYVNPDEVVLINGNLVKVDKASKTFSTVLALKPGNNDIVIETTDGEGAYAKKTVSVIYDTQPPEVKFSFENGTAVTDPLFMLEGELDENATVSLNGGEKEFWEKGSFKEKIGLNAGENIITLDCTDSSGNTGKYTLSVIFEADEKFNTEPGHVTIFKGKPALDGDLSDDCWVLDRLAMKDMGEKTQDYMRYGLVSDGKNLYIGVRVWDNKVWHSTPDLRRHTMSDALEIYIDAGMERASAYDDNDIQLAVSRADFVALAATKTQEEIPGTKAVHKVLEDGYIYEISIPLEFFKVTYAPGAKFGFDIGYNDADSIESERDTQFMWFGTAQNWQQATAFGTAVFE